MCEKTSNPSRVFVFNTRNPQENDFKITSEFEFWHGFKDLQGEDVHVYETQQSDFSHPIVTYVTKRVWKDKTTTTIIGFVPG